MGNHSVPKSCTYPHRYCNNCCDFTFCLRILCPNGTKGWNSDYREHWGRNNKNKENKDVEVIKEGKEWAYHENKWTNLHNFLITVDFGEFGGKEHADGHGDDSNEHDDGVGGISDRLAKMMEIGEDIEVTWAPSSDSSHSEMYDNDT